MTDRGINQAKLLGLCGHAGAGKDYVYAWLKERRTEPTFRVAFADGVRDEVTKLLGLADPGKTFTKPYSKEVRFVLQQWGTDLRRAEDADYWVKYGLGVSSEIEMEYAGEPVLIVFTDVRFENEAAAIRENGGRVLEVQASEKVRTRRLGGVKPPDHASEVMDFEVDGWVLNNIDGGSPSFVKRDIEWVLS